MEEKLILEIVTPSREVLREEVEQVTAPGIQGEFGVLPGHTPFLTLLGIGPLSYTRNGKVEQMALSGGFAEVEPDHVTVLAETCERIEEIDVARARRARERAEGRLAAQSAEIDFQRANTALMKAIMRIELGES